MSQPHSDRDLLLGTMAVQLGYLDNLTLLDLVRSRANRKDSTIESALVKQGLISDEQYKNLIRTTDEVLTQHDQDARQGLSSIAASSDENSTLMQIVAQIDRNAEQDEHSTQRQEIPDVADTRFQVLRPHAKGGLGQVSIALDKEIQREVALKELQLRFASNNDIQSRFLMEAEITGGLEHPGVAPVYGRGKYSDGRPYYAMRLIRGDTLLDAIDRFHKRRANNSDGCELEFRKLIQRFIDVCNTIQFAHSRGVIHRDIKPSNIILGKYGETIVVDWGLAKPIASDAENNDNLSAAINPDSSAVLPTVMGSAVGTPAYMSPEQAAGRHDLVGMQSDIYGLGATLYHLITGKVPFDADADRALERVEAGDFPSPREVDRTISLSLESVCCKAMGRLQSDRYETVFQLSEDLERWLADETVSTRQEPILERLVRWGRNHRTLVASAAAASCVALITLSISFVLLNSAYRSEHASFQQARQTVDDYFTLVSEESLLNQPGLQPLRKKLLERAKGYYQRFATERENDPQLQQELGLARYRLGQITENTESPQDAILEFQQAVAIQRNLIRQAPDDEQNSVCLGYSLNATGRVLQKLQRLDDSLLVLEEAAEIRSRLLNANPENIEYARTLANTYMNIGTLYRSFKQSDVSRAKYEAAQQVRQHALTVSPDNPKLRRDTGKGFYNLANLSARDKDFDAATEYFTFAIREFESLAQRQPSDQELRDLLAISHRRLGDIHGMASPKQALSDYQASLDLIKPLAENNPQVYRYQLSLAGVLNNMASANLRIGETDTAVELLEQAIQVFSQLEAHGELDTAGHQDYRSALVNLSRSLTLFESVDAAIASLSSAIARTVSLGNANTLESVQLIAACQIEMARAYFVAGDFRRADTKFREACGQLKNAPEAIAGDPRGKAMILNALAERYAFLHAFNRFEEPEGTRADPPSDDLDDVRQQLLKNSSDQELRLDCVMRLQAIAEQQARNDKLHAAIISYKTCSDLWGSDLDAFAPQMQLQSRRAEMLVAYASILFEASYNTPLPESFASIEIMLTTASDLLASADKIRPGIPASIDLNKKIQLRRRALTNPQ